MRRSSAITLALMGGGLLTLGVSGYSHHLAAVDACRNDKSVLNDKTGCDQSSNQGGGYAGGSSRRSGTSATGSEASGSAGEASTRGGFGGTGAAHAAGGGGE